MAHILPLGFIDGTTEDEAILIHPPSLLPASLWDTSPEQLVWTFMLASDTPVAQHPSALDTQNMLVHSHRPCAVHQWPTCHSQCSGGRCPLGVPFWYRAEPDHWRTTI